MKYLSAFSHFENFPLVAIIHFFCFNYFFCSKFLEIYLHNGQQRFSINAALNRADLLWRKIPFRRRWVTLIWWPVVLDSTKSTSLKVFLKNRLYYTNTQEKSQTETFPKGKQVLNILCDCLLFVFSQEI